MPNQIELSSTNDGPPDGGITETSEIPSYAERARAQIESGASQENTELDRILFSPKETSE